MPASTFTMPVLLNNVLICEVVAEPLLMNVPSSFTVAVAPLSPPKLLAEMFNPPPVVWSLKVAPFAMVSVPEPAVDVAFRLI